jgi:hypothetical protein
MMLRKAAYVIAAIGTKSSAYVTELNEAMY